MLLYEDMLSGHSIIEIVNALLSAFWDTSADPMEVVGRDEDRHCRKYMQPYAFL